MHRTTVIVKTLYEQEVVVHDKKFTTNEERKEVLDELKKYFFDKSERLFSRFGPLDIAYEAREYSEDCENLIRRINHNGARSFVYDQKINFYIQQSVYFGMNHERLIKKVVNSFGI